MYYTYVLQIVAKLIFLDEEFHLISSISFANPFDGEKLRFKHSVMFTNLIETSNALTLISTNMNTFTTDQNYEKYKKKRYEIVVSISFFYFILCVTLSFNFHFQIAETE